MAEAVERDGAAYRHLLAGRAEEGRLLLGEAAARYRASWDAAPPRSFGRLVAGLKSAILAGDAGEPGAARAAADHARAQVGEACDSPTACYALALAALVQGDDAAAARAAAAMREGGDAFARTADALVALAGGEGDAYAAAVVAIVRDFEGRDAHLTGVPIADTALMLEALAAPRGLAARPSSPLMPTAS